MILAERIGAVAFVSFFLRPCIVPFSHGISGSVPHLFSRNAFFTDDSAKLPCHQTLFSPSQQMLHPVTPPFRVLPSQLLDTAFLRILVKTHPSRKLVSAPLCHSPKLLVVPESTRFRFLRHLDIFFIEALWLPCTSPCAPIGDSPLIPSLR